MKCRYSILSGMVLGWSVITNVQAEPVSVIEVEADKYSEAGKVSQEADSAVQASPADSGDWLTNLPGVSGVKMDTHGIDPVIRGQKQNQLNVLLDGACVFGGCPNRMDRPSSYASTSTYELRTA